MKDDSGSLRIAGVIKESIVDGPGLRFVVFAQGCIHDCEGCHNPDTHDFHGGYSCGMEKILQSVDANPLLSGVTFSGGEPFCQAEGFYKLALRLKERDMHIMSFTGFTYEELLELGEKDPFVLLLLEKLDAIIDGRFVLKERDLSLTFKGSRNQRFIDLNETKKQGTLVEFI